MACAYLLLPPGLRLLERSVPLLCVAVAHSADSQTHSWALCLRLLVHLLSCTLARDLCERTTSQRPACSPQMAVTEEGIAATVKRWLLIACIAFISASYTGWTERQRTATEHLTQQVRRLASPIRDVRRTAIHQATRAAPALFEGLANVVQASTETLGKNHVLNSLRLTHISGKLQAM